MSSYKDLPGLTAADVTVDTSTFNTNLSAADSTAQKALDTLDDVSGGGGGGGDTYKVKITSSDTTADYIASKITVGAGTNASTALALSTASPGGNESRKIQFDESKVVHNNLSTIQGGSSGQYYHLTSAQATVATQASSAAQAGYLAAAGFIKLATGSFGIGIDGGVTAISTGSKGFIVVPYACTIKAWTILSNAAGSIVVDVKKSNYSDFPTTASIAASAKPTLATAQKNTDTTLTGWTTSVSAGDIIEFVVDSATTVTRVNLIITVQKV